MTLSTRIFIGLFAGIATGLFFGELVADLKIIGDVFVKLLQMTVLPYIVVSLVAGFGRMDMQEAKRLALRGAAVLGVIWLLALVWIFVAPLAFPDREHDRRDPRSHHRAAEHAYQVGGRESGRL